MTEQAIKQQIDAIRAATRDALQSKESALKFLIDAGIIDKKTTEKQVLKSSRKK